jgi:hypothetical protein
MHIGPLRIIAATALLLGFAGTVFAANAGSYRSAPRWINATYRSAGGLRAQRILGGRRLVRRDPSAHANAAYKANRLAPAWPAPPRQPFQAPGATVITRQDLDALNATTLRDALRYAPGVIVK